VCHWRWIRRIGFGPSVARDLIDIKAHAYAIAKRFCRCRKVAKDAVIDLLVLGLNRNRFRDRQSAIRRDTDIAHEIPDPLLRCGGHDE